MHKLLVVEDDAGLVSYIKAVLDNQSQFTVSEAYDGVEGFEAACTDPPDVVLVDITMPRRDGLSLLQDLKSDERTAGTKVIMMTGVPSDSAKANARRLGADGFLSKPFSPRQLVDDIARVMDVDLAFA